MSPQQQEHEDFERGGFDLFEGFDRGDSPESWDAEQQALNEEFLKDMKKFKYNCFDRDGNSYSGEISAASYVEAKDIVISELGHGTFNFMYEIV